MHLVISEIKDLWWFFLSIIVLYREQLSIRLTTKTCYLVHSWADPADTHKTSNSQCFRHCLLFWHCWKVGPVWIQTLTRAVWVNSSKKELIKTKVFYTGEKLNLNIEQMDLKVTVSTPFLHLPQKQFPTLFLPTHILSFIWLNSCYWNFQARCKAHFPLTELFVWYLTKTDVHIFYFSVCRLFLFFTIGDTVWKLWRAKSWPGWQAWSCRVLGSSVRSELLCSNALIPVLVWWDGSNGVKSLR